MNEESPKGKDLTGNEKDWLKHIAAGTVRNILANEYALRKHMTGTAAVKAIVSSLVEREVRTAVAKFLSDDETLRKQILASADARIKTAVTALVKDTLSDRLQEAANKLTFDIILTDAQEGTNSDFGKF